jgi:N-acetylglutamate synthase
VRPRYEVRISRDDVGRRVTVRARTHAHPSATDTVGMLRAWEGGTLAVERRDGSLARIPESDLLAARVVPDAPRRRRTGSLDPEQRRGR